MTETTMYAAVWSDEYNRAKNGALYDLRVADGEKTVRDIKRTKKSVCFIRTDRENGLLFALCETNFHGEDSPGGEVQTYRIDAESGELTLLRTDSSCGAFPIALELTDRHLLILNHGSNIRRGAVTTMRPDGRTEIKVVYDEASLCLFSRNPDGTLGPLMDKYVFEGSGDLPFFQESDSPHSLLYAEEMGLYLVPERGSDRIAAFSIDEEGSKLIRRFDMKADKGTGPRNVVAKGNCCYVLSEIEAQVTVYRITDPERGSCAVLQRISTLPMGFTTKEKKTSFDYPHPSAIALSPSGKLLVTATRHLNILTAFEVMPDGFLQKKWTRKLKGKNPRQIICREDEIEVVCMDSEGIVTLLLDEQSSPVEESQTIVNIPRIAYIEYL